MLMWAFNAQLVKADPGETIIDTEVGESRFTTSPARQSPYYWVHVQDHDTFRTRAYSNNFWYTLCGADGTGEPLYYGTWQVSLPASGNYEVFAWIPNPDAFVYDGRTYTPTQYAVYQVYHQSGLSTKVVNQRLRTGNWYSLGTFTFASSATIILNDRTGEAYASTMIAFDAIKFVYVPPFDFNVGVSPSSGSVQQGGSVSATVTVTLTSGSPQTVSLTASGLPSDAYPTFSPSSGYPTFTSTFTISTSTTTPTGTFYITIIGSGGGLTRTTTYALTVIPRPNQSPYKPTTVSQYRSDGVTVIPEGGTTPESTVVFKATVSDPDGESVRLEIELRQMGEPFTGSPTPETISDYVPSGTRVTITRYGLVNADYHWRYRARDIRGAVSDWTEFGTVGNVDFRVNVISEDFSISAFPTSLTIQQGSSGSSTITITSINGFNQPVQLSVPGAPSGVTATPSPSQVTPPAGGTATSILTVSVATTVTPGSYTLTLRGTSGALLHEAYVSLEVTKGNLPNYPPNCDVKLREDGIDITKIDVGKAFNICVGDSTDDTGIKKIRFSYDDIQDAVPTGTWTVWYDWDVSSEDWDAVNKKESWTFTTPGAKEVWAEVKDDIGQTDECRATIFVHPGYAIVVAGVANFWKLGLAIDFNANNAYRVLRNLGFDDEHIYYLARAPQDIDDDGYNEVDAYPSRDNFVNAMQWAKQRVNEKTQFILYLIGHGYNDPTTTGTFFLDEPHTQGIFPQELNDLLSDFPEQMPTFIGIDACYSGVFIVPEDGTLSVPNRKRVIITSAHDDQEKHGSGVFDWFLGNVIFYSDDFWRNVNKGLSLKDAFVTTGDAGHAWLDDNGDTVPNPPNSLKDDGRLAETIHLGILGTENLKLKPFAVAEIFSPGELRVYDSTGRITGLVYGEVREEIPNSFYAAGNKTVVIFDAVGTYSYEVVGTDTGTYELLLNSTETGDIQVFNAIAIPTVSGALHRYTIDWRAISQGGQGVTVEVDSNGDGIFEYTFTSDSELTQDEFIQQTSIYALTITTTVGGTTDPAPGTHTYTANSSVEVTAIPNTDYSFDHWELDTINIGSTNPYTVLMDNNHTLKAVFTYSPPPPPLTASISPLSASILVGQSVTFTSTVSGGYTPYSYQWYLNSAPVSGATSNTWTFTPTTGGIYYVYLKVTDDKGSIVQSETARIAVTSVPVGGYSIPIQGQATVKPMTPYLILAAILTIVFTTIKRKTTRKTKQQ